MMDVETSETKRVSLKESAPDMYERAMSDRESMNQFFCFTTDKRVDQMTSLLGKIPEEHFTNPPRDELIAAINNHNKHDPPSDHASKVS